MKNRYNTMLAIILIMMTFALGCVRETTIVYTGVSKTQAMEQARKSMLGLGLRIVYDDETKGIIQSIKESAGGTSGLILPIGDKTYGGLSSKPSGASDYFALTFYENKIILRIDGDVTMMRDILKRLSMDGGRFEGAGYISEKGVIWIDK